MPPSPSPALPPYPPHMPFLWLERVVNDLIVPTRTADDSATVAGSLASVAIAGGVLLLLGAAIGRVLTESPLSKLRAKFDERVLGLGSGSVRARAMRAARLPQSDDDPKGPALLRDESVDEGSFEADPHRGATGTPERRDDEADGGAQVGAPEQAAVTGASEQAAVAVTVGSVQDGDAEPAAPVILPPSERKNSPRANISANSEAVLGWGSAGFV